jgi:hypothetical protein
MDMSDKNIASKTHRTEVVNSLDAAQLHDDEFANTRISLPS